MSKQMVCTVVAAIAFAGCSNSGGNPVPVAPVSGTTAAPTATASAAATATPTPAATASATAAATATPSAAATATPTSAPTASPSSAPTSGATATPTAIPTATPTAGSGTIVSDTNPITLTSNVHTGGCAVPAPTFNISESGYNGSFTAVSGNTSLVTVAQDSATQFTATEESSMDVSMSTTTTITVTDANDNQLVIPVRFNGICLP